MSEEFQSVQYFSRGKLMITGEYLVLNGALSLSCPTIFGQEISLVQTDKPHHYWESLVLGRKWFECAFTSDFEILETNNTKIAERLLQILKVANNLNPHPHFKRSKLHFLSTTNYNINWGIGSSSSLISNIGYIFKLDPLFLNSKISKGSGYDVATARAKGPIFYSIENGIGQSRNVEFNPPFASNLFFMHLGNKQDSAKEVSNYLNEKNTQEAHIERISAITKKVQKTKDLSEFIKLVQEHESIISSVLEQEPISSGRLKGFPATLKSLGAWGGDFCLAAFEGNKTDLQKVASSYGITEVFKFNELILT